MHEPIENEYFNWLCGKVLEQHGNMYYTLLGILYKTEFVWVIPADEHRAVDGIELRQDFLRETYQAEDPGWYSLPCSVFEMLYALAKRASFQTNIPSRKWFWEIMQNLQLDQFRQVDDSDIPLLQRLVYDFMLRNYDSHGRGGVFPIILTQYDQREIEILYQMHEYISDRHLV